MISKKNLLVKKDNTPLKARFPAIDAHNHIWDKQDLGLVVQTMDATGVACYCDLTGNANIRLAEGGYTVETSSIADFLKRSEGKWPGRFYCFTLAGFARNTNAALFEDSERFVAACIEALHRDVEMGARGLKVLKELGLRYRDGKGKLINVDDDRLSPVWEAAGRLNIPVLIHQADPSGFFEPVGPENEHYDSLLKYPDWRFSGPEYPQKEVLLKRRDKLIRRHPGTIFILPHVANAAENLNYVSNLLEKNPNVYIDFSARLDEIGRQPYTARELFIRHQDRILFGTDMPANLDSSIQMYQTYFRFLETYDEAFYAPDYDGTFSRARWPIYGIGLPDDVLSKIYYKNILKIIPSISGLYEMNKNSI